MPVEPFALRQQPPEPLAEDYDAIHEAVLETERGRWFLHEFARRNRNTDTASVLTAIRKLESVLGNQTAIPALSHARVQSLAPERHRGEQARAPEGTAFLHQLHELRDAILLTKESLPALGADTQAASRNTDFGRIAAHLAQVTERIRADARDLPDCCEQLDEIAASAAMVADLLAEIETQVAGLIGSQSAQGHAPRPAAHADAPHAEAQADVPLPAAAIETPPAMPEPVRPQAEIAPIAIVKSERQEQKEEQEEAKERAQEEKQAEEQILAPAPPAIEREPVLDLIAQMTEQATVQATAPAPPIPDALPPQPAAMAAPVSTHWLDSLAPPISSRGTPGPAPAAVNFNFDDTPRPVALPNPALREMDAFLSQPALPPAMAQTPVIAAPSPAPMPPVAMAAPEWHEPAQEPAISETTFFAAPPQVETIAKAAAPATIAPERAPPPRPVHMFKSADPLAPIMALSDEEKIALFS